MAIREMSFYAVPAYIAKVVSASKVEFWCREEDLDYDAVPPTAVDLSKIPTVELVEWDDGTVEIDSRYTNIPRDFAEARKYEGRIYCNPTLFAGLAAKGWAPTELYRYECLVQQMDAQTIKRFHGFKATVIKLPDAAGTHLIKLSIEPVQGSARELWIELDDLNTCLPLGTYTKLSTSSKVGDADAIFLSSDFIDAEGLGIPKLPESLGVEGFAPGGGVDPGTDPGLQTADPAGPLLNIVSAGSDKELQEITSVVQGESLAQSAGDVAGAIQGYLKAHLLNNTTPQYLDLVGHSLSPQCYLTIGNWTIQGGDLATIISELKLKTLITEQLKVQGVRLLGCATATTPEGFGAMQELSSQLGVEVFGTTQLIDSSDFVSTGFKSVGLLDSFPRRGNASERLRRVRSRCVGPLHSSSERFPAPFNFTADSRPDKQVAFPFSPGRFRAAVTQYVRAQPDPQRIPQRIVSGRFATAITKQIDPKVAWSFRGLLARPSIELLMPRDGGGHYQLQVLVDHQIVRVFPSAEYDQGLVYRVTKPDALRQLVGESPPSRSE